MSPTFAYARSRTPKSPEAAAEVEELRAAISALPADSHEEIYRQLAEAAVEYQATHDSGPLVLFVESLLLTARLHRTPEYRNALVDAEHDIWDEDGVEGESMIAAARDRRSGRG